MEGRIGRKKMEEEGEDGKKRRIGNERRMGDRGERKEERWERKRRKSIV